MTATFVRSLGAMRRAFQQPLVQSCTAYRSTNRSSNLPFLGKFSSRTMATQSDQAQSVKPDLVAALTDEIRGEKDQQGPTPQIHGFEIECDEAHVKLSKTHGEEKILVYFNVNHSVDMDEEIEDEQQSANEAQQQQPNSEMIATPPFSVEITKGGKRLCFHLEIVPTGAEQGQEDPYDFRVEEFYMADAGDGEVDQKIYSSSGKFVDEKLHELLFLGYLEERGIDAEFCENLVHYATYYEHSQYVKLLEKIKAFV